MLVGREFEGMLLVIIFLNIPNQAKAKNQNEVLTEKKIDRALCNMSKSLIPQGKNIKYDEMIMGKEIQLSFQDIRERGY